jgi:hypothetical protein
MMEKMQILVKLLETQYQRHRLDLQSIIKDEMRIRKELAALQEHTRSARLLGLDDEPEMRAMGADVVWERWLERSRVSLNLNLATILAAKEMHLTRVRKSFGKLQATNAKSEQILLVAKKRMRVKSLEQAISYSISQNQ